MGKKKPKRTKRKSKRTAANSDRYDLYELSVQEPGADCDFIEQSWLELRGREPRTLREDFCGTAITAIEWVKRDPKREALVVDIDADVLEIARKRIRARLKPEARRRMRIVEASVLEVETPPADCVLATNFSYFIFKTRRTLKRYFRRVHDALVEDGLFILDVYGGSDSFRELREPREVDGFTYIWDQSHYNPITGDVVNHIHFRFPDRSRIKRAFSYEWRLWTLPELRELLKEAGFPDVTVYWEGTDSKTNEGNGEWSVSRVGEACPGWVCYIVAGR